jgi:regulator of protease activity HflC (stomatin/prohibitin superfamily)
MATCVVCVDQGNVALVESWGKFARLAYPGCHILNPFCGENVRGYVSQRIQQVDVTCESKTKDNVFVNVMVSVQYKVIHGSEFAAAYTLSDTRQQMTAYIFDVVRAILPTYELDNVFAVRVDSRLRVFRSFSRCPFFRVLIPLLRERSSCRWVRMLSCIGFSFHVGFRVRCVQVCS